MKTRFFSILALLFAVSMVATAQKNTPAGYEEYTLSNGLKVFLWEDHNKPDVHGRVVCRAGSVDEPSDYTGLAHYLEHMLFKGTETIGTLDWEKEKPLYEEVIRLYDQLAVEKDEAKRKELIKKINEKSMEEAKYSATDDFSNLIESMGGDNLNAFTSYDLTAYHNDFPAYQMEKWMKVNSDRLINPVFRSFQAELENVFEEFNMYQDDYGTHQREFLFEKVYEGCPYSRDVIGYASHLKNPQISALRDFYNTWYVPNNMCLLLVGNFNSADVKPLIEKYFGRLVPKALPERTVYPKKEIKNEHFECKVGYYPQYYWIYPGIAMNDADDVLLDFTLSMLNNGHNTGMLDRLMLDGTVNAAYVSNDSRRDRGNIMVVGMPYYDVAQGRFESEKQTEKVIFAEIEKLKRGEFTDELFQSVKQQQLQGFKLMFENASNKVNAITYAFAYGQDMAEYFEMDKKVVAITKEDVKRIANKYLNGNHMTIAFTEGAPKKNKLAKPQIQPLDPPKGVQTEYAKNFEKVPSGQVVVDYNNFNDVKELSLYNGVKMFYTENPLNDVFSLTLKYGVGTEKMPKLEYAAALMNTAGMMPDVSATDLRNRFSALGATCSFSVSSGYFYINISGDEKNLAEICKLMTQLTYMPKLDQKQIESVVGSELQSRQREKTNPNVLASALMEYVLYGDKSSYIDRIPVDELYSVQFTGDSYNVNYLLSNTDLTSTIQDAIKYSVDIHYVGQKPMKEVADILKANVPINNNAIPTTSPVFRDRKSYDKTQIFFLSNKEVQQAKVYFYIDGVPYDIAEDVDYDAFNQYFSGGFSGLVMNEIREKRSMAYTAYGNMVTPGYPQKKSYLIGYVGTQSDKVADAIDVYMDLLNNMPSYPERIDNIKVFLRQSALTAKPSFRSKSQVFSHWKELGYTDDPAKVNMPKVDNLKYEQILNFYNKYIKGKPVTIVIMGDDKTIDMKRIQGKYGKVQKINSSKLFKGGF